MPHRSTRPRAFCDCRALQPSSESNEPIAAVAGPAPPEIRSTRPFVREQQLRGAEGRIVPVAHHAKSWNLPILNGFRDDGCVWQQLGNQAGE